MNTKTDQIRSLNDQLRQTLSRNSELAFMTPSNASATPVTCTTSYRVRERLCTGTVFPATEVLHVRAPAHL
ncbi:hypothetical protein [Rhodoplanes sp. Z2-YC6860]|uniref:hypothetical protein n=1 Tax=Rhodoplanes sp. Z2-YC6860 TaxID=674703 RepID=UPI0012EDCE0C|nr:hypothetical protein [Rhodoplanes sp. Z2-YC6860]